MQGNLCSGSEKNDISESEDDTAEHVFHKKVLCFKYKKKLSFAVRVPDKSKKYVDFVTEDACRIDSLDQYNSRPPITRGNSERNSPKTNKNRASSPVFKPSLLKGVCPPLQVPKNEYPSGRTKSSINYQSSENDGGELGIFDDTSAVVCTSPIFKSKRMKANLENGPQNFNSELGLYGGIQDKFEEKCGFSDINYKLDDLPFCSQDTVAKSSSSPNNLQENIYSSHSVEIGEVLTNSSVVDQQACEMKNYKVKGSDWLRKVQVNTPKKTHDEVPAAPNSSSKKRIMKNGFADQLKKVIASKQSNISILGHQIFVEQRNFQGQCTDISGGLHEDLKDDELPRADGFTECDVLEGTRRDENSLEGMPLKLTENNSLKSNGNAPFQNSNFSSKIDPNKKFFSSILQESKIIKGSYVQNVRDSLEIRNGSSSGEKSNSSWKFNVHQKHICLLVNEIVWQNHISTSSVCSVLSCCASAETHLEDLTFGTGRFFVIFDKTMRNVNNEIEVGSQMKIFSPWQKMDLNRVLEPILFVSLYSQKKVEFEGKVRNSFLEEINWMKFATWNCTCLQEGCSVASNCKSGRLDSALTREDVLNQRNENVLPFVVREKYHQESRETERRLWKVSEAVEADALSPGGLVAVTFTLNRLYYIKCKDASIGSAHFLVIGQDPSGVYLVLEVPDRPLRSSLGALLNGGLGTVRTLSGLSVVERITDAQDRSLFSVIWSLQKRRSEAIQQEPRLGRFFGRELRPAKQRFCYRFRVNLGKTSDEAVADLDHFHSDVTPWTDPGNTNALKDNVDMRINVNALILYFLDHTLYVSHRRRLEKFTSKRLVSRSSRENRFQDDCGQRNSDGSNFRGSLLIGEPNSVLREDADVSFGAAEGNPPINAAIPLDPDRKIPVTRIRVKADLDEPGWLLRDGIVMVEAALRDLLVTEDLFLVFDEFSDVERLLPEVVGAASSVPELRPGCAKGDLVSVQDSV